MRRATLVAMRSRPTPPARRATAAAVLAALLIAGLAVAAPPAWASKQSVTVDGATRTFVFHRGTTAPASGAPLMVLLHGAGGSGAGIEGNSGFDAIADRVGALAVYPDGGNGGWGGATSTAPEDLDFMSALVDWAVTNQGADRTRVYFAGFSGGGYFAHRIACERPALAAGIGSVAANELQRSCTPDHPISVVDIKGTDDAYNEGCGRASTPCPSSDPHWHPGMEEVALAWRYRDVCPGPTTPSTSTQGNLTYFRATGCSTGASVLLVKEQSSNTNLSSDQSHCWPNTSGCQYQYDATSLIWSNLSTHRSASGAVGSYDLAAHSAGGAGGGPAPPATGTATTSAPRPAATPQPDAAAARPSAASVPSSSSSTSPSQSASSGSPSAASVRTNGTGGDDHRALALVVVLLGTAIGASVLLLRRSRPSSLP